MKKILGLVFVLALFVPAAAQAKINLYGQFDVSGYSFDGIGTGSSGFKTPSNTYMRAILGANFGLAENIDANVALLYGRFWGEYSKTDGNNPGESTQSVLDTTKIAEANVIFKNLFENDKMSLKIGKFFYGDKGSSVFYIGPKDLNYYVFSRKISAGALSALNESGMDGALLTYNDTKENLKIDVGYSKLSSDNYSSTSIFFSSSSVKENVVFADARYKYNDMLGLQAYVYDFEAYDSSSGVRNRYDYIGIKPSVEIDKLKASLEVIQSFYSDKGRIADDGYERYFAKIDASYQLTDCLTPRAMYFKAGDNYIAPLNDIYLGLALTSLMYYNNGLNGIDCLNAGIDYKIGKFKILADYFRLVPNGQYSPIYEADLRVEYYYTEKIAFKAGIGYYSSERDASGGANYTIYNLGLGWKF
ncbi:MAG: hypothetical protein PHT81_07485 [Endomicrobiaceae bacterium]|nr:hypothetical protein [Endomicrobiaceae bacterium]MDD3923115.1 hypothetical protein [Endomicrobiaceae bacterium]